MAGRAGVACGIDHACVDGVAALARCKGAAPG